MYRSTRRVVCGNVNGRSTVLSDGVAAVAHAFKSIPGHGADILWATPPIPDEAGRIEAAPEGVRAIPEPGGTRFLVIHFPPASVMFGPDFDPVNAEYEQLSILPGLAERFEAENPGMHRTDSVDYDIVLEGSVWLELDDGREIELHAGDVVVQQATRHAWRNKSEAGVTLACVLIGTENAPVQ
jgi:mannose-6-phosphate isomerase-like protein (cupin superfamily)